MATQTTSPWDGIGTPVTPPNPYGQTGVDPRAAPIGAGLISPVGTTTTGPSGGPWDPQWAWGPSTFTLLGGAGKPTVNPYTGVPYPPVAPNSATTFGPSPGTTTYTPAQALVQQAADFSAAGYTPSTPGYVAPGTKPPSTTTTPPPAPTASGGPPQYTGSPTDAAAIRQFVIDTANYYHQPTIAASPDYWVNTILGKGGITDQGGYWTGLIQSGGGGDALGGGSNSSLINLSSLSYPGYQAPAPLTLPSFQTPTINAPAPFAYDPFKPPTLADAQQMPGYQFGLNAGTNATQESAAARGTLNTTGTQQDLTKFATDYANTKFQDLYNQDLGTYQTGYNTALGTYNTNANNSIQTQEANATNSINSQSINLQALLNAYNSSNSAGLGAFQANQQSQQQAFNQNYLNTQQPIQNLLSLAQVGATGSGVPAPYVPQTTSV